MADETEGDRGEPLEWLSARYARELVAPAFPNALAAQEAIIDRAGAGLIRSCCRHVEVFRSNVSESPKHLDNVVIPAVRWSDFRPPTARLKEDWAAGDFVTRERKGSGAYADHRLYDVSFAKADLLAIPGVAVATEQPPPNERPTVVMGGVRRPDHLTEILRNVQRRTIEANPDTLSVTSAASHPRFQPIPPPPPEVQASLATGDEVGHRKVKDERPRLSDADMKRFSQMIVDTYGTHAAEIPTYNAICALFPRNAVPRDHFLAIFREIRPPKNRGRSRASRN